MDAVMQSPRKSADLAWCLPVGSAVGRLILKHDWTATSLGPLPTWPISMQVALSIALHSRFPMILWLGKDLLVLYNDAYAENIGAKHPTILGQPGAIAWAEIWHVSGPVLQEVMTTGNATWWEDQLLLTNIRGYLEESYWTYSFSPIVTQSSEVVGIFEATEDTTARCITERRMKLLHQLSSRTAIATNAVTVSQMFVEVFNENLSDLPFSVIYLADVTGRELRVAHTQNVPLNQPDVPVTVVCDRKRCTSPLGASLHLLAESPHLPFLDLPLPPEMLLSLPANVTRPESAVLLPLRAVSTDRAGPAALLGMIVLGVNAHKRMDDLYRRFHSMLTATAAAALLSSRDYEREKKKAESLAALDRAKTTFFHNISHEFRTPLTLMLGPLDDLLQSSDTLSQYHQESLRVIQRNGARLLKLVNALLDFARIEAGRVVARYVPTDLAKVTSEHASLFRAACTRAGLAFEVDCLTLRESVYVDQEMWEKIVINLLSNAFKYTLAGSIKVVLRESERGAELTVSDTGCGVPAQEQARVFERFYRVSSSKGRTEEGSGIGLALLLELVKIHGGNVQLESVEGKGSSFCVTIPFGCSHLPPEQVSGSTNATGGEVARNSSQAKLLDWMEDSPTRAELLPLPKRARPAGPASCVLVVDDNAECVLFTAYEFPFSPTPSSLRVLASQMSCGDPV